MQPEADEADETGKTERIPCVVLAGGKAKPELAVVIGQTVRALAVVNGQTLLRHVVDAVKDAPSSGPITVVGDVPESDDYDRIPDGGDFVTNIFAGLSAYQDAPFVLIATADFSGESVEKFQSGAVELATLNGVSIVYPIVPVAECYARFPGIKRTARRLREGDYTGGNLVLAQPKFMLTKQERIASAYAARKSPARLAIMLGPETLARLLLSQTLSPNLLTVKMLEHRVSYLLGGPVRAMISLYPEIATDLDRPSDFASPISPPEVVVNRFNPIMKET